MNGLRDTFPAPTLEAWHQECVKLLKGVPFAKKMFTPTYEGITLRPMYTAADTRDLAHLACLPGEAPYVRGGYRQQAWQVAQEFPYPSPEEFNAALVHDLASGQDAVVLIVAEAGRGGTSIADLGDLRQALAGVDLAAHPIHLESGSAALAYAALLVALAREKGVEPAALHGSVGLDPRRGLPVAPAEVHDELALLTRWAASHAPHLRTLAASGHVYHDGGASATQELAFTLAAAVQHLRELETRGVDVETAAPRIRVSLSVGTHFFLEIARLRATRLLWSRIVGACGGSEAAQRLTLHARTSRFTKTILDPHVNILRATTEAMAAVLGGVDSLCVSPFDEPIGLPDTFSRRLARNTHTILREESHLDLVADPAGGTWAVEALTAEVAAATWKLFQEVERQGGLAAALKTGWIQARVAETASERRRNLAERRDVLVGTNLYPNPREEIRRGPDASGARVAPAARSGGAYAGDPATAFEAMVEAAARGATVGELSRAPRSDAEPEPAVAPIVPWRAGEMFERLRAGVRTRARTDPAAVTVFCANLGDIARYLPRLDFTRDFLQTGGFTVLADRFFAGAQEAAAAARASGARSAVIVGLDATYAEQATATARALKAAGVKTVILAGLPENLVEELKAAGVDAFIHARSDANAVLTGLADSAGVAR